MLDDELDRQATAGMSQKSPEQKMLSEREATHDEQGSAADFELMQ